MLFERHARLSLFLTRDYAESTRKDDEILENNGKTLKKILCSFCYRANVPLGKATWTFRWLRLEQVTQKLLKVQVLEKKRKLFMTNMKTQTIKTESIRKLGKCLLVWWNIQNQHKLQKGLEVVCGDFHRLFTVPYFFVRSFRYTTSYRQGYLDFQTQSARSRWSYGKIEDCEQSMIFKTGRYKSRTGSTGTASPGRINSDRLWPTRIK